MVIVEPKDLMHNDVNQCYRSSNVHCGSCSYERNYPIWRHISSKRDIYTRFQCYVHRGYLSTSLDSHLSTSSFDVLFEISQSQPMHADVCFMSFYVN